MTFQLDQLGTILVTGANSGIGKDLTIRLLNLGSKVIAVDRSCTFLTEYSSGLEAGRLHVITHDLSSEEGLEELIRGGVQQLGMISGFVHAAGIASTIPLKILRADDVDKVFKINTFAAISLAKICTKREFSVQAGMSNIFISSVYSLVGSSANSSYAASKAAINGLCRSLSIEFAPRNIRFNCVAPGFVATDMLNTLSDKFGADYLQSVSKMHPLGLGSPEDISNIIIFLLSYGSRWITGAVIPVDGGYSAQ
jgi:NAD(P)-dependent dehydrogenase (short-subunit alcohol dehydrogenase family)